VATNPDLIAPLTVFGFVSNAKTKGVFAQGHFWLAHHNPATVCVHRLRLAKLDLLKYLRYLVNSHLEPIPQKPGNHAIQLVKVGCLHENDTIISIVG
jgi:hypothetical protein